MPDFKGEEKILEQFKLRDRHHKKRQEAELEDELRAKYELELFIQQQAIEY